MKGQRIAYSHAELHWIQGNAHRPRPDAHAEFVYLWDRPDVSATNYRRLCIRNGWLAGNDGRFKPGQPAPNKGKPMPFHPNSAAARFQPGRRPHTWRGPGHESVDPKDGYVWLIVAETNPHTGAATRRVMKHRWLWERAHGPVPDGHALKSRDGDRTNTDPANWIAVPRGLLPRLNGRFGRNYDTAPPELKPLLLTIAQLEHAARAATKGGRDDG